MTTIESISILNKVFKKNQWSERDIDEFVFDNFCHLLDNLSEIQRELLIELVERYKWISLAEYPEKILSTFDSVDESEISGLSTVYLFPVIKPEDEGKFKSGQFLMYQIKSFKRQLKKFSEVKFKLVSKFEVFLDPNFELQAGESIFLIDDYIGSGESINACLTELLQNKRLTLDKFKVFTIAIQKNTASELKQSGIFVHSYFYSPRGISDYNESPLLDEKLQIMREIEKLIPGGSHFSMGYNGSEALVTMARTPDNTFPIFWKDYKIGKAKFKAPFSREETFEL